MQTACHSLLSSSLAITAARSGASRKPSIQQSDKTSASWTLPLSDARLQKLILADPTHIDATRVQSMVYTFFSWALLVLTLHDMMFMMSSSLLIWPLLFLKGKTTACFLPRLLQLQHLWSQCHSELAGRRFRVTEVDLGADVDIVWQPQIRIWR